MKSIITKITWKLQKLFRAHGCSDRDLRGMDYTLAKTILPKLVAFKKSNREGYPCIFLPWSELKNSGSFKNKQDFDKAVKAGTHIGGGAAAWEDAIDAMIFGFEFTIAEMGTEKEEAKFREKHGDYLAEIPSNKQTTQWYQEGDYITTEKTKTPYAKEVYFFDHDMYDEFEEKAIEGLALFGRYFRFLHD